MGIRIGPNWGLHSPIQAPGEDSALRRVTASRSAVNLYTISPAAGFGNIPCPRVCGQNQFPKSFESANQNLGRVAGPIPRTVIRVIETIHRALATATYLKIIRQFAFSGTS